MTPPAKVPVAALISGAGSNMAALIDAGQAPDAAFEVVLVVSNRPHAGGLAVAEAKGVAAVVIDHAAFTDRRTHEAAVDAALTSAGAKVVALAGYMRVLTPWLVERWAGRMLNVHPSLLPAHAGLDTHARALAAGDAEAGCTIHLVTAGVDEGPILAQARTPVLKDDTPSSLAQRVQVLEHQLYPATLAKFCRNAIGGRPC